MSRDVILLDSLRAEGWEIIGSGFKIEDTFTAKDINIGLWKRVKDLKKAVSFPCLDDNLMFWVAVRD